MCLAFRSFIGPKRKSFLAKAAIPGMQIVRCVSVLRSFCIYINEALSLYFLLQLFAADEKQKVGEGRNKKLAYACHTLTHFILHYRVTLSHKHIFLYQVCSCMNARIRYSSSNCFRLLVKSSFRARNHITWNLLVSRRHVLQSTRVGVTLFFSKLRITELSRESCENRAEATNIRNIIITCNISMTWSVLRIWTLDLTKWGADISWQIIVETRYDQVEAVDLLDWIQCFQCYCRQWTQKRINGRREFFSFELRKDSSPPRPSVLCAYRTIK